MRMRQGIPCCRRECVYATQYSNKKEKLCLCSGEESGEYPYNATFLALCFSALTMGKIRLVIAPLDPGHKGEALLNRIRMEGQHNFE